MARSKKAQFEISVTKRINMGSLPLFVQLGHKGLEKSQPTPVAALGADKTYSVSNDILEVSVKNPTLYNDITEIEFTYSTDKIPF